MPVPYKERHPIFEMLRDFTPDMKTFLSIYLEVGKRAVREKFGGVLPDEKIAEEIYEIENVYRLNQLGEQLIKDQSSLPLTAPLHGGFAPDRTRIVERHVTLPFRRNGSLKDSRPKKIQEKLAAGHSPRYPNRPTRIAHRALILGCKSLLEEMNGGKGANRRIGFSAWDFLEGQRMKSRLQQFTEEVLSIIDPMAHPPKSSYYSELSRALKGRRPPRKKKAK